MNARYHLVDGKVKAIGFNTEYNTMLVGSEPFADNWDLAGDYEFIGGVWQIIPPVEPSRYVILELAMPDRLGYQRKLFVNKFPEMDFINGRVIVEIQVKHYIDDMWKYDNNIQDKVLVLTADDNTRIPIDNEGNTWGEFQYFAYLFQNFQVFFFDQVKILVQDRIDSGLIDSKLQY